MVSPIVLALVFGIFEFSLLFRAHLTTSNMAQQGARAAAAFGQEFASDKMIVDTILEAGAALDDDEILFIVIFLASGPDDVPGPSCMNGNSNSGANACNVYTPDQWTNTTLWRESNFGCQPSQPLDKWYCPMDRLTRSQPPGYVGVYVKTRHSQATGLFGSTTVLEEQAVVRFEPDPPEPTETT
jgi:hypothetical protein